MAGLPPFATGTPELIVEKILQTSYDVVKYVAENMDHILVAEDGIAAINAVAAHIEAIITLAPQIENLQTLSENLDAVAAVAANVEQILSIYDDLETIVNAATQTAIDSSAAVAAKNESISIRDNLLLGLNVVSSALPAGSVPTATYDPNTKQIALGIPLPYVNTLSIGSVVQGTSAAASIDGTAPNQTLNLTIPKGDNSWTPVFALVASGSNVVQKIVDWVGGTGTKPTINVYVTATGYSANIADAVNIRGAAGAGTGDMLVATYDPSGKNSDAFNMSNMVEGTTNKIFTATERTKLGGIAAGATANSTDATLLARANHTGTQAISTIDSLQSSLDAKLNASARGAAFGVAPLDGSFLVPLGNLPTATKTGIRFGANWNADTNTPPIPAASSGNNGTYYLVTTAGDTVISGIGDWQVGDMVVSKGDAWIKIKNSESVQSVAGKTGAVTLDRNDVGLSNVANKSEAQMVASGAIADALNSKATSSQGALADSAVQPSALGSIASADILTGTADPDNGTGANGDIYFQYDV